MTKPIYSKFITNQRIRKSDGAKSRTLSDEFSSDKHRIIFSSPFRRLQMKAQVFSLETNASVRSRLTHSIEVATIGIVLAEGISNKLIESKLLDREQQLPFIKIVENACLLHDIGNPPFGHFAENAIKEWFTKNWESLFGKVAGINKYNRNYALIRDELINDFIKFDGNPQAVRIITKLQDYPGLHSGNGLNLTYAQILSVVKYNCSASKVDTSNHLKKKPGYFYSEKDKIEKIKSELGCEFRYPLTYIMEAADDISYCLSDIEDGIEKEIITTSYFFEKLFIELKNLGINNSKLGFINDLTNRKKKMDFLDFKINLVKHLNLYSINSYITNHSKILDGSFHELIEIESEEGKILKALKVMSRKYLFRSKEAENKELAGYKIISGILDAYKPLFEIDHEDFFTLVNAKNKHESIDSKLDYEWRLFNRLPRKHVLSYEYDYNMLKKKYKKSDLNFIQLEWFYRAHLIIDYITGMTDNYSLETYRLLYGIKIK